MVADTRTLKIEVKDNVSMPVKKMSRTLDQLKRSTSDMANAFDRAQREVDELGDEVKKTGDESEKTGGKFKRLTGSLTRAKVAFGAVAVTTALMGRQFLTIADTVNRMDNRLRLVTNTQKELNRVSTATFQIANRSRVGWESTVDLYARIARTTKDLNISQAELLAVTETISQAVALSGASAESADAALMQLGQGFAAGALRGEELNSILEQTPMLAETIATGLGVGVGALKAMGAEGELTADKVIGALQKMEQATAEEFGKTKSTIAQASTVLGNSLMDLVGDLDEAIGASNLFAEALLVIANNIDSLNGKSASWVDNIKKAQGNIDWSKYGPQGAPKEGKMLFPNVGAPTGSLTSDGTKLDSRAGNLSGDVFDILNKAVADGGAYNPAVGQVTYGAKVDNTLAVDAGLEATGIDAHAQQQINNMTDAVKEEFSTALSPEEIADLRKKILHSLPVPAVEEVAENFGDIFSAELDLNLEDFSPAGLSERILDTGINFNKLANVLGELDPRLSKVVSTFGNLVTAFASGNPIEKGLAVFQGIIHAGDVVADLLSPIDSATDALAKFRVEMLRLANDATDQAFGVRLANLPQYESQVEAMLAPVRDLYTEIYSQQMKPSTITDLMQNEALGFSSVGQAEAYIERQILDVFFKTLSMTGGEQRNRTMSRIEGAGITNIHQTGRDLFGQDFDMTMLGTEALSTMDAFDGLASSLRSTNRASKALTETESKVARLRFQGEAIQARTDLQRDMKLAGGDVYLQQQVMSRFEAQIEGIGRSSDLASRGGGAGGAGGAGGTDGMGQRPSSVEYTANPENVRGAMNTAQPIYNNAINDFANSFDTVVVDLSQFIDFTATGIQGQIISAIEDAIADRAIG